MKIAKKFGWTIRRLFKIFTLLSVFLFITVYNCSSQQFGGNPPSLKWQQINTDTARIIFPTGLEGTAQRVASIIHDLNQNHNSTIGNKLHKINIVLQNQTTISNAYVGLGPYRGEFYLFPPQNSFSLGALNWVDNLSLHEYRHVQQYSNFNVGLSKVASVIFGQEGQALANAAAIPDWFFEGDAVFNETSLSKQGRGRIPDFYNPYKSLLREGKSYSFMKLRNGSYKDFVPGHYELGYLLVAYGREKYGPEFWKNVTQDAAAFKPLIYPLQGAIKKYSNITYKQFVANALNFYDEQFKQQKQPNLHYLTATNKRTVTDYKYPYFTGNGKVIVLKSGYRQIPAFYQIDESGNEHKLAVRDIANDDYFSYNNGKIVYSTYNPDARWGYREYSDIKVLDVVTGERKRLTNNERYFSPDISHQGTKVVSVEMKTDQESNLVVLDMNGEKSFRSVAQRGVVYTYPKFSANDDFIYTAVRNEDGEMALRKIELATAKQTTVLPFSNRIIGFPTVQGDTIFFSSSYKGSDEVWAYIESKNATYRVATNPTGFYQATFDRNKNRLIASAFTAEGYRLAAISANELLWQKINENENTLPDLYTPAALKQEKNSTLQNIAFRNFNISKYRKATGLFNFHSWRPYYDQPEYSFTIYGQNILNTLQTELAYTYNANEKTSRISATGIYGATYVQPTLGVSYTFNRIGGQRRDTTFYYNELTANAGLRLPLNLSGGRQVRSLTLSSTFNIDKVIWTGVGKRLLNDLSFNYLQTRIVYTGQIQKAVQQIYPRWAQTIELQYNNILNKYTANQFLANGYLYLPGFHINHNIVLSAAYQQRDTMNQYTFSNSFPFSRGYQAVNFPRMWRLGANYHLPLFYPDFGVANIVYFLRVRANAFYDYTQVKSLRTGNKFPFKTVGGELFFDTKWWNQQPVSFGLRYSHLLNKENSILSSANQWEIILPVNLF